MESQESMVERKFLYEVEEVLIGQLLVACGVSGL